MEYDNLKGPRGDTMKAILISKICTVIIVLFAINVHAIEFKNGVLFCNKDECRTTEKRYFFHRLEIKTILKEVYPDYIKKVGVSHFASIDILKNHEVIWRYKNILDPLGDRNVGISSPSVSPNKKAMAITIIGNYLYEIFLIFSDHYIDKFNGGRFTWERNGTYLFSTINEEIPTGFLIYSLDKKKIVFKTNKLITDWHMGGEGRYLLAERPNMLEGPETKNQEIINCYSINLLSKKIELVPARCKN
jgi:hypothetical protein